MVTTKKDVPLTPRRTRTIINASVPGITRTSEEYLVMEPPPSAPSGRGGVAPPPGREVVSPPIQPEGGSRGGTTSHHTDSGRLASSAEPYTKTIKTKKKGNDGRNKNIGIIEPTRPPVATPAAGEPTSTSSSNNKTRGDDFTLLAATSLPSVSNNYATTMTPEGDVRDGSSIRGRMWEVPPEQDLQEQRPLPQSLNMASQVIVAVAVADNEEQEENVRMAMDISELRARLQLQEGRDIVPAVPMEDITRTRDADERKIRYPQEEGNLRPRRWMWIFLPMLLIGGGIAAVIVVFTSSSLGGRRDTTIGLTSSFMPSESPTTSLPPTLVPSSSPTLSRRTYLLEQLLVSGNYAFNSTEEWDAYLTANFTSPQARAIKWLSVSDVYASQPATLSKRELEERYALVLLYYATSGPYWHDYYHKYYLNHSSSVCEWNNYRGSFLSGDDDTYYHAGTPAGVTCGFDGLVNGISLMESDLDGNIPSELSLLRNLETIFLDGNYLLGGTLPTEFEELSKLEILHLAATAVSGPLSSWRLPISLRTLAVFYASVSGTLPSEWGLSLPKIRSLILEDNRIEGTIPTQWGNLSTLQSLYVSGNHIGGTIPSAMGNLQNLRKVYFSGNFLSGTIPTTIGSMTSLTTLDLSSNQLSGSIPSEIGNLSDLRELRIGSNPQLSGTIPTEITGTYLQQFSLHNTSITGSLDSLFCDEFFPPTIYADCEKIECTCCSCSDA